MASIPAPFAHYCCELLSSAGPCVAKRMFGGWGISTDGLTLAIVADLGVGEILWLKARDDTRARWAAAGCTRFTYISTKDGQPVARGMNYYSAPEDAMDSPHAMAPWARLALDAALAARAPVKAPRKAPPAAPRKTAKPSTARTKPKAPAAPKKP